MYVGLKVGDVALALNLNFEWGMYWGFLCLCDEDALKSDSGDRFK